QHRRIAPSRDILDDRRDYRVDICRDLALCLEQLLESRFETRIPRRQCDRHQLASRSPFLSLTLWAPCLFCTAGEDADPRFAVREEAGERLPPTASRNRSIQPPISSGRVFSAVRLTISRELTSAMRSISTRPLAFSVAPV